MMQDDRTPLPAGTRLYCENGDFYTIREENFGYGGSSLVYSANRTGSSRLFVIKECFPINGKYIFTRGADGIVCPVEADNEQAWYVMEQSRRMLEKECRLGQEIASASGRAIAPWEETSIVKLVLHGQEFDARKGIYIVMEQVSQKGCFISEILEECSRTRSMRHMLRTGGLPDIHTVADIIGEVLKALDEVHRAGYLYGDIQSGNIFFQGPRFELGEIGVGHLLDFGCAKKLEADGKTPELVHQEVYSTPGYCCPEILLHNDGHLRLSPAADIFSVGCLMLYLLKGMQYKEITGKKLATIPQSSYVSHRELAKRGATPEISAYVNDILKQALDLDPEKRFQNAFEMLEVILELKAVARPAAYENMERILEKSRLTRPDAEEKTADQKKSESDPILKDKMLIHLSAGQIFLPKNRISRIGREAQLCDFTVKSDAVSQVHALLSVTEEGAFLCDNHSTNGTSVEGRSIAEQGTVKLCSKDQILLGDEMLFYVCEETARWIREEKKIAWLSCAETGEIRILDGTEIILGRQDPWKHGSLSDKRVGRVHGRIRYQNGKHILKLSDTDSVNGTYFENKEERLLPSSETILTDGCQIRLGRRYHIQYRIAALS